MAGLYIHIPFCLSKCGYCDFYSYRPDDVQAASYVCALLDEITTLRRVSQLCESVPAQFSTVYIGGGTPSVLGGEPLAKILDCISERFSLTDGCEITVECNPSSCSGELFSALKNAGANRISLGLQSSDDAERKALGRRSGARELRQAVDNARAAGFQNISVDVMLGIPHQTMQSLKNTLDFCLSLDITHISSYILKIEDNTYFKKIESRLSLPDDDEVCDMYLFTTDYLAENGFHQYEISNYSREGFESRHNLNYWDCGEYLGIGPAAHSFLNGSRFFFPRDTQKFIEGNAPVFDCRGGDFTEYAMLRLRLTQGLTERETLERFNRPIGGGLRKNLQKYVSDGFAIADEDHIALTPKGFLISNTILSNIL